MPFTSRVTEDDFSPAGLIFGTFAGQQQLLDIDIVTDYGHTLIILTEGALSDSDQAGAGGDTLVLGAGGDPLSTTGGGRA